jgi:hypothetical protein
VKVSLICFLLSGCVIIEDDSVFYEYFQVIPHTKVKDPILKFHVENFVNDFKDIVPKEKLDINSITSYRFQSLGSDFTAPIGRCIKWPYKYKEILISPYIINDYWILKAVVYHELAHCLFDLDHSEELGIMFQFQTKTNSYYRDNWKQEFEKFKKYVLKNIK